MLAVIARDYGNEEREDGTRHLSLSREFGGYENLGVKVLRISRWHEGGVDGATLSLLSGEPAREFDRGFLLGILDGCSDGGNSAVR
jgi:hypothetical protein